MIQAWQNFLKQANGIFKDELVLQFGSMDLPAQQQAIHQACLCDLSHYGLLKVAGQDARTFLQGQVTCDMDSIHDIQGGFGAYCNRKGRVGCCFRIYQHDNAYYLHLPRVILGEIQQELQKYILFSKVALEDVSDNWVQIGVLGQRCANALTTYFEKTPQKSNQVYTDKHCLCFCILPDSLYFIIAPIDAAKSCWDHLRDITLPVGWPAWERLEIEHQIPEIYPNTKEIFLPHSIRLPELEAVSFTKGCYRGQEIIARMEYKSRAKKSTVILSCQTLSSIQAGQTCQLEDGTKVGTVVRIASLDSDTYLLLIELPVDIKENTPLFIEQSPLLWHT